MAEANARAQLCRGTPAILLVNTLVPPHVKEPAVFTSGTGHPAFPPKTGFALTRAVSLVQILLQRFPGRKRMVSAPREGILNQLRVFTVQ